ncbi:MAG: WecB/TagA/CpsF family glycosyltransferase [Opitutales bacterium]|nr:WecB/TagA/CpsF family glycosyltransferase [Opitutales bacterium]
MCESSSELPRPFGLSFFRGNAAMAVDRLRQRGGLLVAPSGPGLAEVDRFPLYAEALRDADLVLIDSGALVLGWALMTGEWLPRLSGYAFFDHLIASKGIDWAGDSLWVLPSVAEANRWRAYMQAHGQPLPDEAIYIAPMYEDGEAWDPILLERLRQRPVHWVLIQVGGGVQEPLGAWLKSNLEGPHAIVCTGAAMAFVTGSQVRIPWWADRMFLGWLLRIFSHPRIYGRRYIRAFRLFAQMLRTCV